MFRNALALALLALALLGVAGDANAGSRPPIAEDDPAFVWALDGNLSRGVTLVSGRRLVVDAARYYRLRRAGRIDLARTPRLRGDYLAAKRGNDPRYFAQEAK